MIRAGLLLLLLPAMSFAHGDEQHSVWQREMALLLPLFTAAVWYAVGWVRLKKRVHSSASPLTRNAVLFGVGWLTIAVSLLSPLHTLGRSSFTAHMTEHELLMLAAAPLIALSRPLALFLWALPHRARHALVNWSNAGAFARCWRGLSHPLTATALQAAVLWLWHAPSLFDAALRSEWWHAVQHVSFLASALLFWWTMTRSRSQRQRAVAAVYLFVTSVVTGALGALMAISASPWYAGYAALGLQGPLPGGLSAAEDQQLAGLVMWIPGGLVHFIAALIFAKGALRAWNEAPLTQHTQAASSEALATRTQ